MSTNIFDPLDILPDGGKLKAEIYIKECRARALLEDFIWEVLASAYPPVDPCT